MKDFLKKVKAYGYKECVCYKTTSFAYEIETLSEDKNKIQDCELKVSNLMKKLNILELHPEEYKKMMDDAFANKIKTISKQKFVI